MKVNKSLSKRSAVLVYTLFAFVITHPKVGRADQKLSPVRQELERLVKTADPAGRLKSPGLTDGSKLFQLQTLQGYAAKLTGEELIVRPKTDDVLLDSGRIISGNDAQPQEFPWQIALLHPDFGTIFCGGTYIGNGWIVTAAHCVINGTAPVAFYGSVSLLDQQAKHVPVKKVVIHPSWDKDTLHNDIALLRIDADAGLPAATLAKSDEEQPPSVLQVSGWGRTSETGSISLKLLKVEVPLASAEFCSSAYPGRIDSTQICAGASERDSCQGDSGGPLSSWHNGRGTLVGVVSYGSGCGRGGFPGIYTRVSSFKVWIDTTMAGSPN